MAHGRLYKSLLGVSIVINSLLCLLFTGILIYAYIQKRGFPTSIAISFLTFIALFVTFLGVFVFYLLRKTSRFMVMAVALSIARFLSVLIISFVFMSEDNYPIPEDNFTENIISWIQSRKLITVGFTFLYLPIFLLEVFVLNRYYSKELEKENRNIEHVYETTKFTRH